VSALWDVDGAWDHFLGLLRDLPDPVDFVAEGWLRAAPPRAAADDAALAAYVRQSPGALEARLHAFTLAQPAEGAPSSLEALLRRRPLLQLHGALGQTLEALDPAAMLRVLAAAHPRISASMLNKLVPMFALPYARRLGASALGDLGLPPELCDVLRCWITREPLPDILPGDVHRMSAAEISLALSDYMGMSTSALEARFAPGGISRTGFLGPGERIGEVIRRDAQTLHRLGIPRHAIAERLDALSGAGDRAPAGPFACSFNPVIGYQHDPFHSCDVYDLTRRGGAVFVITNNATGESLRGGDLLPLLIRRACFFEGSVRYRMSPERAVRVLGLG
jgi:hypothetical protein